MSTDTADAALTALAADIVEQISVAKALELTAGLTPAPPGPRPGKDIPAIRQDKRWCSYCGASGKAHKLTPGPDKDFLGDQADLFCADEQACIARNRARHGEHEQAAPPAPAQQEPPQSQLGQYTPPGWSAATANGVYDVNGTWHPALPQFSAYSHTLMNPAHRAHLLSGQQRPHYYGGPHYVPPGVLGGQQSPQEPAGSGGVPAVPPDRELDDRGMYEAARGGGQGTDLPLQQPQHPAGLPQRPPRDRYGRRRYRGRR